MKNGNYTFLDKHCISGKLGYAAHACVYMMADVIARNFGVQKVELIRDGF